MIEVKGLVKTHFNSKQSQVTALKGVNLVLPDAGFIYLKGASGSGKSTLISILGGLDTFDEGVVLVDGRNLKNFTQKQLDDWRASRTAFVFQDINLLGEYTVAENIRLGKNFSGGDVSAEEISEVLKRVGLSGYENRFHKDISGGERQRVAIARALVKSPSVIFVDEPTAQIDNKNARHVLQILKEISKEVLIICVSHDERTVEEYSDRIIELQDGKVSFDSASKRGKLEILPTKRKDNTVVVTPPEEKIRHIFKIAFRNIFSKKFRIMFLVILTCITMLFSSVFYMLSNYDHYEALASSVVEEEELYTILNTDDDVMTAYNNMIEDDYKVSLVRSINTSKVFTGIIEYGLPNGTQKNKFGQETMYGAFPTAANGTEDCVAITDYIAKTVVLPNYSLANMEDIIRLGCKVQVSEVLGLSRNAKICGIIKTDYADVSEDSETFEYKANNIYRIVHAAPGFINQVSTSSINNRIYIDNSSDVLNTEIKVFGEFWAGNSYSIYDSYKFGTIEQVLWTGTNLTGNGFVLVSKSIWEKFADKDKQSFTANINGVNRVFACAGVIDSPDGVNTIVVSNGTFSDQILKEIIFPADRLAMVIDTRSVSELKELIRMLENSKDFSFSSSYSAKINDFTSTMITSELVLGVSSILLILFTLGMFYYFATLLILDNKKNIGILRSLGATRFDIVAIYGLTVGLVALVCWLVSSILSVGAALIINAVVSSQVGIPFNIITFNPLLILILFGMTFGIGIISTAIPITKYSFQPPIKQIKR